MNQEAYIALFVVREHFALGDGLIVFWLLGDRNVRCYMAFIG